MAFLNKMVFYTYTVWTVLTQILWWNNRILAATLLHNAVCNFKTGMSTAHIESYMTWKCPRARKSFALHSTDSTAGA